MKRKTLIAFVSACLISFVVGAGFIYLVYGQTAPTFWVTQGVFPSTTSFTISREGSYYFGKNAYGQISTWGLGVSNISLLLQTAYNNLPASGGKIFLQPASYVFDTPVLPVSNSELCGVKGASILTASSIVNGSFIRILNVHDVSIHDLTLDGNSYFYACLEIAGNSENITVTRNVLKNAYDRNLWLWDYGTANKPNSVFITDNIIGKRYPVAGRPSMDLVNPMVDFSQCENVIFSNNILRGDLNPPASTSYPAILLWGGGTYETEKITISNNVFQDHHQDFIRVVNVDSANIIGNIMNYTQKSGVLFQDASSRNVIISNNMINYAYITGIWVRYSSNVVVSNNVVIDTNQIGGGSQWQAITIGNSTNATITGNILENSYHGISINADTNNTIVSNNQIQNMSSVGIYLINDVQNITVTGNSVIDSAYKDIMLANDVDGSFFAINHVSSIYLSHTASTCDWNRFFGNIVSVLSQTAGAPTGNTYVDNYPDNTP